MSEIWMWERTIWPQTGSVGTDRDLTGYDVEATDGSIGKIDKASMEADAGYLVVDTGWWIFGKKRMIPAGLVTRVDDADRKVYLSCTKDHIKDAPDYDEMNDRPDNDYRTRLGGHYRM